MAAVICYYAIRFRQNRNLDESMDVWACQRHGQQLGHDRHRPLRHRGSQRSRGNGLFYGNPGQLAVQALAWVVTMVFAFA